MDIDKLLKDKSGIRLDIGGGANPQPGFVNIDMLPLPQVDIVWDLEELPWPLPDECVTTAVASHVLEHINPHKGVFIKFMDEIWRTLKPYAQFAFVVPHAQSPGYAQDPTHCNMLNETTMHYFDPDPEGKAFGPQLYNFYKPKPWKIEKQFFSYQGNLEVLLSKRPEDKSYLGDFAPSDITKEKV
jgi:SAM-dependent methyltransferase